MNIRIGDRVAIVHVDDMDKNQGIKIGDVYHIASVFIDMVYIILPKGKLDSDSYDSYSWALGSEQVELWYPTVEIL